MQLEIDGQLYELPDISSFDLDEDRIFYKATGLHAEDVLIGLQEGGGLSFRDVLDNEGYLSAVAHIAYRREHENEADDVVMKVVGRQKRVALLASLLNSAQGDDDPKDEGATNAPDESSTRSSSESESTPPNKTGSSGTPSETSSVPQVVALGTTGTPESDTSQGSGRMRRVV